MLALRLSNRGKENCGGHVVVISKLFALYLDVVVRVGKAIPH